MSADQTLLKMAETFNERNAVYKDNYTLVGKVMSAFYPSGVTLKNPDDFEKWHLFELKIIKLTRFVLSDMTHIDSIHDDAVLSAMLETLMQSTNYPINH